MVAQNWFIFSWLVVFIITSIRNATANNMKKVFIKNCMLALLKTSASKQYI